jgi:hypothetical protein
VISVAHRSVNFARPRRFQSVHSRKGLEIATLSLAKTDSTSVAVVILQHFNLNAESAGQPNLQVSVEGAYSFNRQQGAFAWL